MFKSELGVAVAAIVVERTKSAHAMARTPGAAPGGMTNLRCKPFGLLKAVDDGG